MTAPERCRRHPCELVIPALGKCARCAFEEEEGRAVSRRRKVSGNAKEQLVEASLKAYAARGDVVGAWTSPPVAGRNGALKFIGLGPADWIGRFRDLPLAFDVKGITGHSTYVHPAESKHQLGFLLDWTRGGVGAGFLLLVDGRLERMWILHRQEHFAELAIGRGVPVYRKARGVRTDLLPTVSPSTVEQMARGAPGYDFLRVYKEAFFHPTEVR